MSSEEEELPKKERIINAWIAGGEDTSPADIAEVTGASEAYASRIGSQMEEGELDDDEIEEVRNDQLVEQYADRLRQLTEASGDETGGRGKASADGPGDEGQQAAQGRPQQPQGTSGKRQRQQQAQRHPTQQQPQQARQQRARSRQATSQRQSPTQQAPPRQSSRRQGTRGQGRQAQQATQQSQHAQRGPQQGTSQSGNRTVDVEQLRELDEMLAFIQDEADFEMQNLPPEDRGAAAGKMFVAREARAALQSIVEENDQRQR